LQPETWLHEAGIASNRSSARCGEFFFVQVQTARQASEVHGSGNWRDLSSTTCYVDYFHIS